MDDLPSEVSAVQLLSETAALYIHLYTCILSLFLFLVAISYLDVLQVKFISFLLNNYSSDGSCRNC